MIELPHKTSATVAFARNEATEFYCIPSFIGSVFSQTGATITALDLGLRGESIRYMTDHGQVALIGRSGRNGARQVSVTCDALIHGARDTDRTICFQIVRRLIGRLSVSSVFWHATRQRMTADRFTWDCLTDTAQRWGASYASIAPSHR